MEKNKLRRFRRVLGVVEEFKDVGSVGGGLGRGDSFAGVEGAPGLDEAAEGVVGDEIVGGAAELLLGDRAGGGGGVVACEEPFLDAFSVVGYAGGDGDGIFHELHGDRTKKITRYFDFVHYIVGK